ncbi:acetyltransferase (GNAT) family protein [Haloactinopolyspora alba]|uniref:Acetyltransferase (GNAT) family protein n=1 Tax=Haloactinopolyspora alba TaxID=648780 RepID=A0A2P8E743_9ACTN|nr:GNAT family N-acetyltransferase [Haloactinopolyspora alba]PSL05289.1 acetyltransferase (GNAT) family protein [Haloactinopolyspora alba]
MQTATLEPLAERAVAPERMPELPDDAGLTWRAVTASDVPEWYRLTSVVDDADEALERRTQAELAQMFEGGWRDARSDSVAGFDVEGRMRAYAWSEFRPATEGTHTPVGFGAVHPDDRGRGLGRALIAWTEARARRQLAGADVNLPARICFYVDEHNAGARRLVERAGFEPRRWYVGMRRDLSATLPAVQVPDGLAVVPYTRERDEQVRETHNEAFARDHWGSSPLDAEAWALNVIGGEAFRPDWSFVALDTAGTVVGYLVSGAYRQDWEPQGYTEGWTDLVAVRRPWRRHGVAASLLTVAMRAYAADGMQYAGLDVDTDNPTGALGLYTRLGYERQPGAVLLTKEI